MGSPCGVQALTIDHCSLEVVFQIKSVAAIRVSAYDTAQPLVRTVSFQNLHNYPARWYKFCWVLALRRQNFCLPSVQNKTNLSEGIHQHVQYMTDFLIRFCENKDVISKAQIQ